MLMENIAQIAAVNADFFCDLGKADLFLVMGQDIFAGILRYLPGFGELQGLVRAEQGTDRSMEGFRYLLFGKAAGGKKAVNRGKEFFISGFAIVDFNMGAAAQVVQQVGPVPQKRRCIEGIFKKCGIGSRIHIKLFPVGRKVIPIDAAAGILKLCD